MLDQWSQVWLCYGSGPMSKGCLIHVPHFPLLAAWLNLTYDVERAIKPKSFIHPLNYISQIVVATSWKTIIINWNYVIAKSFQLLTTPLYMWCFFQKAVDWCSALKWLHEKNSIRAISRNYIKQIHEPTLHRDFLLTFAATFNEQKFVWTAVRL